MKTFNSITTGGTTIDFVLQSIEMHGQPKRYFTWEAYWADRMGWRMLKYLGHIGD